MTSDSQTVRTYISQWLTPWLHIKFMTTNLLKSKNIYLTITAEAKKAESQQRHEKQLSSRSACMSQPLSGGLDLSRYMALCMQQKTLVMINLTSMPEQKFTELLFLDFIGIMIKPVF